MNAIISSRRIGHVFGELVNTVGVVRKFRPMV
jgi:hypothetical protein